MKNSSKRIELFDLLRVYGCFAVVLLHVVSGWKDDPTYSSTYFASGVVRNIFDNAIVPLVVRPAVPFFFMISGALFLDNNRNISWNNIKSHIRKLCGDILIFGYAMSLIEIIVKNRHFEAVYLWDGFLNVIQERSWSHMWFLYATIGLYFLTPMIWAYTENITEEKAKRLMLYCVILFSIIPTINSITSLEITRFGITSPGGAVLCFLTGHFLVEYRECLCGEKKKIMLVGMAGGITIAVGMLSQTWNRSMLEPFHLWIYLYSSSIFALLVLKHFEITISKKIRKVIISLSRLSLPIYIIHPLFLNALYKGFHYFPNRLVPVLGELLIWVAISIVSTIGAYVMTRIPGINRLV